MIFYGMFILNVLVTLACLALIQSRSRGQLHLLTVIVISLFVAYPFKALVIVAGPDGFMTFQHDLDGFNYFFIGSFYFLNMLACITAVYAFMPAKAPDFSALKTPIHPTIWLTAIAVTLIVTYGDIYRDYYVNFSLVKNELRRMSLEAQIGKGWITVLMLCGLPLVYLSIRSEASRVARFAAVAMYVSVLLVIGSRAYLLGAVLLAAVAVFGFSPVRATIALGGLAIAAAVIGMLSWGEDQYVALFALQRFMQTYDGFDLYAAYLQQSVPLLWGETIFEDIVFTYIPRFIWLSKPFLFGSNELVATIFPDLSDTQGLLATFPSGFLLEQYANFSFFGVFLAFLLFALLARHPDASSFSGRFVYLGLFAFAPTFFRSGASFITLFLLLGLVSKLVEWVEQAASRVKEYAALDLGRSIDLARSRRSTGGLGG